MCAHAGRLYGEQLPFIHHSSYDLVNNSECHCEIQNVNANAERRLCRRRIHHLLTLSSLYTIFLIRMLKAHATTQQSIEMHVTFHRRVAYSAHIVSQ